MTYVEASTLVVNYYKYNVIVKGELLIEALEVLLGYVHKNLK